MGAFDDLLEGIAPEKESPFADLTEGLPGLPEPKTTPLGPPGEYLTGLTQTTGFPGGETRSPIGKAAKDALPAIGKVAKGVLSAADTANEAVWDTVYSKLDSVGRWLDETGNLLQRNYRDVLGRALKDPADFAPWDILALDDKWKKVDKEVSEELSVAGMTPRDMAETAILAYFLVGGSQGVKDIGNVAQTVRQGGWRATGRMAQAEANYWAKHRIPDLLKDIKQMPQDFRQSVVGRAVDMFRKTGKINPSQTEVRDAMGKHWVNQVKKGKLSAAEAVKKANEIRGFASLVKNADPKLHQELKSIAITPRGAGTGEGAAARVGGIPMSQPAFAPDKPSALGPSRIPRQPPGLPLIKPPVEQLSGPGLPQAPITAPERPATGISGVTPTQPSGVSGVAPQKGTPEAQQTDPTVIPTGKPGKVSGEKTEKNILADLQAELDALPDMEAKQARLEAWRRENPEAVREIEGEAVTVDNAGRIGLEAEARKHKSFNDFEKAWLGEIKHGQYWHITEDPSFRIDPQRGPRDMSSIASGREDVGKLMITSDLERWAESYTDVEKTGGHTRAYAALIDMTEVPSDAYWQVNRGFGNEFFVDRPDAARVVAVLPIDEAMRVSERWDAEKPQSSGALRSFYEQVHARPSPLTLTPEGRLAGMEQGEKTITEGSRRGIPPAEQKPGPGLPTMAHGQVAEVDKPIPRSKLKTFVRKVTGQTKIADIVTTDERTALRAILKAEQKAARLGFQAGKKEGSEKAKARAQKMKQRAKERAAARNEINKMIKDIQRIPTGGMDIEYQKTINALKSKYDFKKRTAKTLKKRERAKEYIERLKSDGMEIDHIPMDVIKMIDKVPLNDLSIDDLRQVHREMMRLSHLGRLKKKLKVAGIERDFQHEVDLGSEIISQGKFKGEQPTWIRSREARPFPLRALDKTKAYGRSHLFPEVVVEQFLDHGKHSVNGQVIIDKIIEASGREYAARQNTLEIYDRIAQPGLKNINKEETGRLSGKFTHNEAMHVYANTFNEYGVNINRNSGISEAMEREIIDTLSPTEKKVVEQTIKFNDEYMAPRIGEVYERDQGIPWIKEPGYFRITHLEDIQGDITSAKLMEQEIRKRYGIGPTGVSTGLTKERKWHKRGELRFDFYGNQYGTIAQGEHYINTREAVREVNRYLNNDKIRGAVRQRYPVVGQEIMDGLNRWLKEFAQGGNKKQLDMLEGLAGVVRRNFVVGTIAVNLTSIAKAPLSFIAGADIAGEKAAVAGLYKFLSSPIESIKNANELSPFLKERSRQRDVVFAELLKRDTGYKKLQGIAQDIGFEPWKLADSFAVYSLWWGTYDRAIKSGLVSAPRHPDYRKPLRPGDEQKNAVEIADFVIRRSQPLGTSWSLPDIYRSGNLAEYKKFLLPFMGQLRANTNLVYTAVREFQREFGKGKSAKATGRLAKSLFYYLILSGFMIGIIQRKRMPTKKEFALDVATQGAGSLLGIGGMIRAASTLTTYGRMFHDSIFAPPGLTPIEDTIMGTMQGKYYRAGLGLATVLGVPGVVQIDRILKGKPFGSVAPSPSRDTPKGIPLNAATPTEKWKAKSIW